ncbi:MAG: FAD-linked oxidase C-terminal domain-containing protein [Chloroflexota bacterium]|nr:FAD-linked oxidase C-terminal domain-containing protein [Chloroflexota bacterium]
MTSDLIHELQQAGIDVRTDPATRTIYSTDASIYQIEPLGVAFPRTLDQLSALVELAGDCNIPIIARGAGSGLAGQAVGAGLIVDCSRYLNRILALRADAGDRGGVATVQPGLVLSRLNQAAAELGLQVGPDPASDNRATLGGCIANNASGSHSIVYGMFADHLEELEVILSDGSMATLAEIPLAKAERIASGKSRLAQIYAAALTIRQEQADTIRANWPQTWRCAAGYNLNYLLPWSPSAPLHWKWDYPPVAADSINLAPLVAGSEGTLAIIRKATVRLVPKPKHTILAVLAFESNAQACDVTPDILEHHPSAVELIPRVLLQLARDVPAYARKLDFIPGGKNNLPGALLVVEFSGDDPEHLLSKARQLRADALIAESPAAQKRVWDVRKAGLGILQSHPGDQRTQTFIEDLSVPVERLGEYVGAVEKIAAGHNTKAYFYAHASAGCLHTRPLINLKTQQGVEQMEAIASAATDLVIDMGGSTSGEHGDGLARSQWLKKLYGDEVVTSFIALKEAADPQGILNPGKIVDPLPMNHNLRYGANYQARGWQSSLSFERQGGLDGAIEICNGSGDCRQSDGVMCPSFQATQEEIYATRGRANLLRAFISGTSSPTDTHIDEQAVFRSLDLCLACKGCKSECPSAVDMAKLKYAFLEHFYQSHRRKLRDYVFGYFHHFAQIGSWLRPLANTFLQNKTLWAIFAKMFGLAPQRMLPEFRVAGSPNDSEGLTTERGCVSGVGEQVSGERVSGSPNASEGLMTERLCLLLSDPFTQHFHPETLDAALRVLSAVGYRAEILPVVGAGRTLISKGFLAAAKKHARKLIAAIVELDPEGQLPIIGIEPSEIYTLSDEYPDFFPHDEGVTNIAQRAWMLDEFLVRDDRLEPWKANHQSNNLPNTILLHGHCYQKARPPAADGYPVGVDATVTMLEAVGYQVEVVDAGCCGMAGAFGYEAEHYELSMQVGEMALFPAVRGADEDVIVAASGVSCQSQIEDGADRVAVHPIILLESRTPVRW